MTDIATEHIFDNEQFAGFWRRFLSVCIDFIVFAPPYYGIHWVLDPHFNHWVAETLFIVLSFIAYGLLFSHKWQATPGMYVLNFYICDTHGKRLRFWQAVMWCFVNAFGVCLCAGGILYMQSHFDVVGAEQLLLDCLNQNIVIEDCQKEVESVINIPFASFMNLLISSVVLFSFLSFIWALSIGLAKDKAGFNNLICHTRFIKGRTKSV